MAKEFNQYKLPENWNWVELGDILETTSGGTPSRGRPEYYNGTIPWVKSGELNYNIITKTEEQITDAALQSSSAKLFPKGTLLIALYGATVGRLAFLGIDASTNQAVCGIFENSNINIKYIYYCLMNQYSYLISLSAGGAQPNISQTIIKKVNIPLPPLNEQNRIVEKLDELLSELEKGKEQLQTSLEQLKVYRQSILKHAFEGKLTNEITIEGHLPNGWEYKSIEEISSVLGDGLHGTPKYNDNGEYYFINGNNLSDGIIEIKPNTKRVSKSEYDKYKKPLNENTVFVSINGSIGYTAFYNNEKVVLGKSACYFNVIEGVSKFYVRYYIKSNDFIVYANKEATGSTIKNLGLRAMRDFQIPFPPTIEEQNKIVQEIEKQFSICYNLEETLISHIEISDGLKKSILMKAFEGKLVEQNPTDEPASVLLERIKKEREGFLINNKIKKKSISQPLIDFPKVVPNIAATDLHAGIISMIIDAHVCNIKYNDKLNHVKCEKIIDLVERKLGISLGRKARKDAAGPDDYPHLKKVEHRAKMIGAFSIVPLEIGHTYRAMKNMPKCIEKVQEALTKTDLERVNELINTFLPFDLDHAELVATIYAGWNNLLIKQQIPSDEEIIYESRENWSKRKLTIPREKFFKTLNWMRTHNFIPEGKGQLVLKNNKA